MSEAVEIALPTRAAVARRALVELLLVHWRAPLGVAVLLVGGFFLIRLADVVDVWYQAAAWMLLALVFIFFIRGAASAMVGPVLGFDIVRTARRSHYPLIRSLYALLLLFVLFLVYSKSFGRDLVSGLTGIMDEQTLPPNEMAGFAASFFHTFLIVQFSVMVILAPAFTAGAIAEEKEKRTLPDLLTTELTGREIVFGKMISRVSHLILMLLTGLPVLALLQLLGGVEPALLVAGFALTLLSSLGIGSVGLLCSVYCARPRDAVFMTYIIIAGYQLVSGFYGGMFLFRVPDSPVTFVLGAINGGNIGFAYLQLRDLSEQGKLGSLLVVVLCQYLMFHGCLAAVCTTLGVAALRRKAMPGAEKMPTLRAVAVPAYVARREAMKSSRPRLGDRPPMMWKECYVDRGIELHPVAAQLLSITGIVVMAMAGTVFACGTLATVWSGSLPEFSNGWLKVCVPATAMIALLGLGLRASGTFSSEREKQTLDSLMTSDLTAREVLSAKMWGCLWSMKTFAYVMGGMIGLGVVTAGIFPPYVALLAIALVVQVAFVISLGMYCSLVSRSTLRATVATVSSMLGFFVGHYLLMLIGMTLLVISGKSYLVQGLSSFHTFGLTPPVTLYALIVTVTDKSNLAASVVPDPARVLSAVLGTGFYGVLTLLFWWRVRVRFADATGR